MITNLDTEGLSKIAFDYDLFYIDIWGVIHNGLELNLSAIETLKKLEPVSYTHLRAHET